MLHAGQRQLIALLNAHLERGKLGLADDGGTDALVLGDGVVVEHVEGNKVLAEVHISKGEILAPLKGAARQAERASGFNTNHGVEALRDDLGLGIVLTNKDLHVGVAQACTIRHLGVSRRRTVGVLGNEVDGLVNGDLEVRHRVCGATDK